MRAGAARVDSTPPVGVKLGGFAARYKPSEGIHDSLFARAIYLEDESTSVLLVSADVVDIHDDTVQQARRVLSTELGMKEGAILIAATHTHSGPSLKPDITSGVESDLNDAYSERFPSFLVEAGEKAKESSIRAFARWGLGHAEIAYNRRVEGGPTDPQVIALSLESEEGEVIASLVNYACHGVVLGASNYKISGDWMGYTARTLEKSFGGKHVSVYTNAATGDLNPITSKGYACLGTFDDAQRLGIVVANAALEGLNSSNLSKEPTIAFASSSISVKKVIPTAESAERLHNEQLQFLEKARKEGKDSETIRELEAATSYTGKNLRLVRTTKFSESDEIQVQAVRVGGLALATMPGEPVVRLGLELKRRSPFSPTGLVSYANGYHGYIPMREDYERGGYESTPTWWNRLAPGTGELLLEEDLRLLERLK